MTPNFSEAEFTRSATAIKYEINNSLPIALRSNVHFVAVQLEIVRVLLDNTPIIIQSGYRCPALNKAVGGAPDSHHSVGMAVDIRVKKGFTPLEITEVIKKSSLRFDQMILYDTFVHLGFQYPLRQMFIDNRR